ncbi:MAG TPA: carbamoyl phosphate synthase large subunit, partial [Myxococcales bacterium]|nr:carbamoyl phosphate synthase large subunit [Myxococcales bacterium]
DQGAALKIARDLHRMDFRLFATPGMAELFRKAGLDVDEVKKVSDGSPNPVDLIRDGKLDLIINTPYGDVAHADGIAIRSEAVRSGIPMLTTLSAAQAAVNGIRRMKKDGKLQVKSLQELHGKK